MSQPLFVFHFDRKRPFYIKERKEVKFHINFSIKQKNVDID
ncbi:hypothetical protein CU026_1905 [Enterococcus faecium]|uniref:Uncharacterized protein n=1 Tax=Enterococcus faecium R496 TaxID=1134836 RepID=A0AAV3GUJ2_ENTFC|nr:hypothetical protein EfmU0317_2241 [Enterococcus faecium U0317]EFR70752.1 hypothetical protein HMPREF9526_02239 [Enterococcus faecium TX0133B]EFR74284.1 hypothetical protein HMPREF9523_01815 [Enterococcus faecium TX0133A]EFR77474.1 hypothetical protein HMPREF9527_01713 [Enterococcus faecium TX0133C]EJX40630.1 hypothetical protein HMPREF1382_02113 [Enterococcus faecium S447]EJX49450.1 hypothetical protein HMPREF1380_01411 [Enterococcus faecium R499]EJX51936.1 hypothetical protein HMPREF1378